MARPRAALGRADDAADRTNDDITEDRDRTGGAVTVGHSVDEMGGRREPAR